MRQKPEPFNLEHFDSCNQFHIITTHPKNSPQAGVVKFYGDFALQKKQQFNDDHVLDKWDRPLTQNVYTFKGIVGAQACYELPFHYEVTVECNAQHFECQRPKNKVPVSLEQPYSKIYLQYLNHDNERVSNVIHHFVNHHRFNVQRICYYPLGIE